MTLTSISGLPLQLYVRQLIENTSMESVNQAAIVSKDLYAANGVIHIIDSVLLPNRYLLHSIDGHCANRQTALTNPP